MTATGRFSATVMVGDHTLSDVLIEGLAISDDVLELDSSATPSKVPVAKVSEFTVTVPLRSDISGNSDSPNKSKITALTFFLSWYRQMKSATPTLAVEIDQNGKSTSVKFERFLVSYLKSGDTLFTVCLEGVFPVGISLSDLTNPGSESVSITFVYDKAGAVEFPSAKTTAKQNVATELKKIVKQYSTPGGSK